MSGDQHTKRGESRPLRPLEPSSSDGSITPRELLERAAGMHEEIRSWRRTIHRYPELTFTEHRTAGLVNAVLSDLGIETETEIAKADFRMDEDALPIGTAALDAAALRWMEEKR